MTPTIVFLVIALNMHVTVRDVGGPYATMAECAPRLREMVTTLTKLQTPTPIKVISAECARTQ